MIRIVKNLVVMSQCRFHSSEKNSIEDVGFDNPKRLNAVSTAVKRISGSYASGTSVNMSQCRFHSSEKNSKKCPVIRVSKVSMPFPQQ